MIPKIVYTYDVMLIDKDANSMAFEFDDSEEAVNFAETAAHRYVDSLYPLNVSINVHFHYEVRDKNESIQS